jgi:hypothetical protein
VRQCRLFESPPLVGLQNNISVAAITEFGFSPKPLGRG